MINKIILLSLIIISFVAKNNSIIFAGIIVFILSFINKFYNLKIQKDIFLNIGMIFLMIWMLMPIMDNQINLDTFNIKNFLNINGLIYFLSGIFVVILAAKGLQLLDNNPISLASILAGSIIGVTFFNGIPVGILTGSGIAYLIIKILQSLI